MLHWKKFNFKQMWTCGSLCLELSRLLRSSGTPWLSIYMRLTIVGLGLISDASTCRLFLYNSWTISGTCSPCVTKVTQNRRYHLKWAYRQRSRCWSTFWPMLWNAGKLERRRKTSSEIQWTACLPERRFSRALILQYAYLFLTRLEYCKLSQSGSCTWNCSNCRYITIVTIKRLCASEEAKCFL